MTRDFLVDSTERAIKTAAQAMILVLGADAFDVMAADWPTALSFGGGGLVVSYLTSLLSLKLGNSGTASATDAVVTATYADAVAAGRSASGLRNGPEV
jgi:hypothetical protein